jgi:hypothetical protein
LPLAATVVSNDTVLGSAAMILSRLSLASLVSCRRPAGARLIGGPRLSPWPGPALVRVFPVRLMK